MTDIIRNVSRAGLTRLGKRIRLLIVTVVWVCLWLAGPDATTRTGPFIGVPNGFAADDTPSAEEQADFAEKYDRDGDGEVDPPDEDDLDDDGADDPADDEPVDDEPADDAPVDDEPADDEPSDDADDDDDSGDSDAEIREDVSDGQDEVSEDDGPVRTSDDDDGDGIIDIDEAQWPDDQAALNRLNGQRRTGAARSAAVLYRLGQLDKLVPLTDDEERQVIGSWRR